MIIKNYYTKAAMLIVFLGLISAIQSCTKKNVLTDAKDDEDLVGAWKRAIPRSDQGDSVQTVAFYEGTLSTLKIDTYDTPGASTPASTLYKGTYNTNGAALYLKLNQKLNSTDPNSSGTPFDQTFFDKVPYKISPNLDTLTVTVGGTLKFTKVNQ
jgi:hypothetical protein